VLAGAVERDPENIGVRLHLSLVLVEAERYNDALSHLQTVLAQDPTNTDALGRAAFVCEKLGDLGKATGYRRLHDALIEPDRPPQSKHERSRDGWDEIIEDTPERKPILAQDNGGNLGNDDFIVDLEQSDLRLDDVAGMERVKRRLNLAFLSPLKNP